jgi:hypothetical protein
MSKLDIKATTTTNTNATTNTKATNSIKCDNCDNTITTKYFYVLTGTRAENVSCIKCYISHAYSWDELYEIINSHPQMKNQFDILQNDCATLTTHTKNLENKITTLMFDIECTKMLTSGLDPDMLKKIDVINKLNSCNFQQTVDKLYNKSINKAQDELSVLKNAYESLIQVKNSEMQLDDSMSSTLNASISELKKQIDQINFII